jgi:hypothetical protein
VSNGKEFTVDENLTVVVAVVIEPENSVRNFPAVGAASDFFARSL